MINEEIKFESLENATPRELADAIVKILDARKAKDIRLLKFKEGNDLTDYFVLATGTATTQIKGYAGEIEYFVHSIVDGTPKTVNTPESACATVKLIEALRESAARDGEKIAYTQK